MAESRPTIEAQATRGSDHRAAVAHGRSRAGAAARAPAGSAVAPAALPDRSGPPDHAATAKLVAVIAQQGVAPAELEVRAYRADASPPGGSTKGRSNR